MVDVFISYSRKDKDFVQKLHEALLEHGRKVWVDWEDIPLAVDWRAEIRQGIETAHAIAFIISPDFLNSIECSIELELAEEFSKRLIPVFHREVEVDLVPPSLRALNWIYFRENDDFAKSLQGFNSTIDTDPDWIKAHTRLTQRALEWESKAHKDSLLLRGDDLTEAEQMLSQTKKEPKLSEAVGQYVIASRKSATHRQRNTLLAVTIGLVVAVILAIVAVYNYFVAEQERALAFSRELTASAQTNLMVDPELSALLALQALDISQTPAAQTLLGQSAQALNTKMLLAGHTNDIYPVAFSPDGSRLLTFSLDGTARVWDAASGNELQTITYQNSSWEAAFSPNAALLAIVVAGDNQDEIEVWDVASGEVLLTIPLDAFVNNVVFSSDNTQLAAATGQFITIFNLPSGEEALTIPLGAEQIAFSPDNAAIAATFEQTLTLSNANNGQELLNISAASLKGTNKIVFSPDGQQLATANADSKTRLWDVETGDNILTLIGHTAGWVNDVAFSSDGNFLATAGDDRTVRVWDAHSGNQLFTFLGHADRAISVAFSPDGAQLLSGSEDDTARLWQTSRDILSGHIDWVDWAAYNATGARLLTGSLDGTAKLWDTSTGKSLLTLPNVYYDFSPDGAQLAFFNEDGVLEIRDTATGKLLFTLDSDPFVAFSPDNSRLATALFDAENLQGEISVLEAASGDTLLTIPYDKPVSFINFSPDGSRLVTISVDDQSLTSEIVLWDATAGRALLTIPYPQQLTWAGFNSAGTRLGAADISFVDEETPSREAAVWDAASGQLVFTLPFDAVNSITYNQDQTRAASVHNNTLQVWDVESGQVLFKLPDQTMVERDRLMLSPSGQYLAMTNNNAALLRVWQVDTQQMVMSYQHPGQINDIDFDRDNTRLAAGTHDRLAIVWDIQTGQELLRLSGHTNGILFIRFSPDGRQLVTTSQDGTARLNLLNPDELQQTALSRLSRWWTSEECQQYLRRDECPPDLRPQAQ